jgi:glucose-1-phosphate thymidylyltransferase
VSRERAVILARGLGTRMREAAGGAPLGEAQRAAAERGAKALMPVASATTATRPFLDYSLSALADAGYTDVCLVVAPDHEAFARYYRGPGRPHRLRLDFAVQESPRGTADAVAAAAAWTGDDPFLVINGDNYYAEPTLRALIGRRGAATALFRAETLVARGNIPADRVGAFALCVVEDGRLVRIVEKATGTQAAGLGGALVSMNCWRLPPGIHDACRRVAPSARGELEIADAVMALVADGVEIEVVEASEAVLDLSRRGDVAAIERALAGVTVDP